MSSSGPISLAGHPPGMLLPAEEEAGVEPTLAHQRSNHLEGLSKPNSPPTVKMQPLSASLIRRRKFPLIVSSRGTPSVFLPVTKVLVFFRSQQKGR